MVYSSDTPLNTPLDLPKDDVTFRDPPQLLEPIYIDPATLLDREIEVVLEAVRGGAWGSLRRSIEDFGILNPILVRQNPKTHMYRVIEGKRRTAIAIELELERIPTYPLKNIDDGNLLLLTANLQRKPNAVAEYYAIRSLVEELGMTPHDIAQALHIPHTVVNQRLTLARVLPGLLTATELGQISYSVTRELARYPGHIQRKVLADLNAGMRITRNRLKEYGNAEGSIAGDLGLLEALNATINLPGDTPQIQAQALVDQAVGLVGVNALRAMVNALPEDNNHE